MDQQKLARNPGITFGYIIIFDELRDGPKPQRYITNILQRKYEEAIKNLGLLSLLSFIKVVYNLPNGFAREILETAEKEGYIAKSGENYKLNRNGIDIARKWDSLGITREKILARHKKINEVVE